MADRLPVDAPAWRRHTHPEGYAYGWLLGLILVSLAVQLGTDDEGWARVAVIVLQGGTLLAALRVSEVHPLVFRLAALAGLIMVIGAAGVLIGSGELGRAGSRAAALLLALVATAAVIRGIVRQVRETGRIHLPTMFGVLCVYLLIGTSFGFAYGLIDTVRDGGFFAQVASGTQSDYLYFSFATLTTTGYGDLTAATDLGRSLAITEALLGQIYLVTVVAVIVSRLGRASPARG